MSTVTASVKRHPAVTYFALTFAISWGGILLIIGGPGGIRGTEEQVESLQLFVLMAWFAGPSVAGVLLTGIVYGKAGLRDLVTRLVRWQVGGRWYAVAILTAPLLVTVILFALLPLSPAFRPGLFVTGDRASLLLFGIVWGLIGGGFLEELGWTGFAVPTLRRRYDVLTTGLVVGFMWGALHLLITYWVLSGLSLTSFLLVFVPFHAMSLPAYRVLMVWVYDRTGESLLVAMLMHASFSASRLIFNPVTITDMAFVTYDVVLAAALWILVAAVAVATGGQLSRRSFRREAAREADP